MHGDIVEAVFGVKEADVDQRSAIEAKPIDLIQHEDLVGNMLLVQECGHVRHELKQLVKAIPEWHDYG